MIRSLTLALALAGGLAVAGCQTSQQTGTLAGGAIGAGTGALVGNAVSRPRPRHCVRWGWSASGHRVCTAWR